MKVSKEAVNLGKSDIIDGLYKRELFAALVLQGLLARHGRDADEIGLSKLAVDYADALLEALSEGPEVAAVSRTTKAKKQPKHDRFGEEK